MSRDFELGRNVSVDFRNFFSSHLHEIRYIGTGCYVMFSYKLSLTMALSEPQYSSITESDSKVEQGNDNLIACDGNGIE